MLNDRLDVIAPPPSGFRKEAVEKTRYGNARREARECDAEEELRVLYVGLTRAEERLFLCGALKKKAGGPESSSASWMDWLESRLPFLREAPGDPQMWNGVAVRTVPPAARAFRAPSEAGARAAVFERRIAMLESAPAAPETDAVRVAIARFEARDKGYFETVDLRVTELADYLLSGTLPLQNESAPLDEDAGRGPASTAEFGTLYHRMLQRADFSADAAEEVPRLVGLVGPHLDAPARRRMSNGLAQFFASEHGLALRRAWVGKRAVYRELPFLFRIADASRDLGFLSGQADLLYFDEGKGWVLVDYKTGRRSDVHREQLRIYAHCIGELLGQPVARAEIYYAGEGESEPVDIANGDDFPARLLRSYERLREETLGRRMRQGFCRGGVRGMLEYRS